MQLEQSKDKCLQLVFINHTNHEKNSQLVKPGMCVTDQSQPALAPRGHWSGDFEAWGLGEGLYVCDSSSDLATAETGRAERGKTRTRINKYTISDWQVQYNNYEKKKWKILVQVLPWHCAYECSFHNHLGTVSGLYPRRQRKIKIRKISKMELYSFQSWQLSEQF